MFDKKEQMRKFSGLAPHKALYGKRKKVRVNSRKYVGYGGNNILTAFENPHMNPYILLQFFCRDRNNSVFAGGCYDCENLYW